MCWTVNLLRKAIGLKMCHVSYITFSYFHWTIGAKPRVKFNILIKRIYFQLNMKVFQFERPLVRLSGSATGMDLHFSQNSLQFGRVRRRGCKILKVMLFNKGDFGTR